MIGSETLRARQIKTMLIISGTSHDAKCPVQFEASDLRRLGQVHTSFRWWCQEKQRKIRTLLTTVIEKLRESTNLTSDRNPFRSNKQHRQSRYLFCAVSIWRCDVLKHKYLPRTPLQQNAMLHIQNRSWGCRQV